MTGIAVVTTRLSSVTMKTATDVIANVHSALGVIRSAPAAESSAINSSAWLTCWAMALGTLEHIVVTPDGRRRSKSRESPARVERRVSSGRGAAEAMYLDRNRGVPRLAASTADSSP